MAQPHTVSIKAIASPELDARRIAHALVEQFGHVIALPEVDYSAKLRELEEMRRSYGDWDE